MLKTTFDPTLPYRCVEYLRMSSDKQNERSPDQQKAEIETRLKALGLNWKIVKTYRDDAKSGLLLRKRREYQRMLQEIRSGQVVCDLILVDMLERFGRVEELQQIRKDLYERSGVLILTADSNFQNPMSVAGKALSFVETIRSTEHSRALAHNVMRGKRDTVKLGHWPGGKPPFGFKLQSVMKQEKGREVVDYSIPVPDPKTSWIIVRLFHKAADSGWGTSRLTKFLNEQVDIPAEYKPFSRDTVGFWLGHELFYGELVWPKHCTGIVDDRRVKEANDQDEIFRVPDFSEAIVTKELWLQVQKLRELRRQRHAAARSDDGEATEKQIQPPAPGMTLNYLLSGLVFCSECGLRMKATSSGIYVAKSGEERRYTFYVCPNNLDGNCTNDIHVPEAWLREMVVEKIRERLFPA